MKKFLAIFLAAVTILSMATMCISAYSVPTKKGQLGYIDYFDFSNKDDRNRWSERYEEDVKDDNGKVIHKKGDLKVTGYTRDEYKNDVYPAALLQEKYSYDDKLSYTFKENGEVAVFTAETADTTGISFKVASSFLSYTLGAEKDGNIEYVKMRIKNNSAASKFSIGAYRNFGGNSGFDARTVATVDIEPNMGGWTTYTFSARDLNFDQQGGYNWSNGIQEISIFPFGYGTNNQGYEGAEIEIDYIVLGSFDYVSGYISALEEKENSAREFDVITPPSVTKYYTGDKLSFEDFEAQITFNDGTKETITSASAVYDFEKPEDKGEEVKQWETPVQIKYGSLIYEYTVTVVDVESVELDEKFSNSNAKKKYNKIDVLREGKFTPTGFKLMVNFADGTSKIKTLNDVKLEGTDFTVDVPLTEKGYYEYIITVNYYGNTVTFPAKIIDIKDIELTPVDANKAIYYGTVIENDFFNVNCIYTDDSTKTLADSGLAGNFSVKCDTAIQGGKTIATAQIYNASYDINIAKDVEIDVKTPTSIEVKLKDANEINLESTIYPASFTISYKYDDGHSANINSSDPNLTINYDTSVPGVNKGKVKIGNMNQTFDYTVLDATYNENAEKLEGRTTVKLLAPKFPTFWLVTIIVAAVIAVLVAAFCVLKFVFKVEFKPIKKFDLDEIF